MPAIFLETCKTLASARGLQGSSRAQSAAQPEEWTADPCTPWQLLRADVGHSLKLAGEVALLHQLALPNLEMRLGLEKGGASYADDQLSLPSIFLETLGPSMGTEVEGRQALEVCSQALFASQPPNIAQGTSHLSGVLLDGGV